VRWGEHAYLLAMKPAPFTYHAPASLDEALGLLAAHGEEARPLAGGQSLVPMMNMRIARPEHLVDLNGVAELSFLREEADAVVVGALVRHAEIERSALLRRVAALLPCVAETIGHYAIRTRGTIGGSLALADPAAQWPLLAMLLDAQLTSARPGGTRTLAARDFFIDIFTTALEPGELLVSASFPRLAPDEGWGYRRFARRHGDFAIVAAAATLALDGAGRIERLRLALGGVGGTPVVLDALASAQQGRLPGPDIWEEVAGSAARAIDPSGDIHASAALRRELAAVLTRSALGDALARTGAHR